MRIKWIKAHRELRTGTEKILSIYVFIYYSPCNFVGLPHDSAIKNLPANAGDMGSTPGSARSPGEGTGNPLQYSCLGNLMCWGAWWATAQWGHKRVRHDLATLLLFQKQGCSADIQVILTRHFCLPCSICPLFRATVMDYTDQCNSSMSAYHLRICLFFMLKKKSRTLSVSSRW